MEKTPASPSDPAISSRPFGELRDGTVVEAWTLKNPGGLEVEIITYGGIVTSLLTPDKDGSRADIVLGFDKLEDYLGDHPYFGAVVGRIAGRVAGGRLEVGEESFSLDCNDPPNHLHGGPNSIDRKVWKAIALHRPDKAPSLELRCHSPHRENGYPGAVDLTARYTLTEANELIFETEARTDRITPISLTQHSYFNLAGEGSSTIHGHELQIESGQIFSVDKDMTLLGSVKSAEGSAADFRQPKPLHEAISGLFQKHGDLYWLGESPTLRPVATVRDQDSGRVLRVSSDLPCLQLYTSVSLDGSLTGQSGHRYPGFSGLCLECEGYPQANTPGEFGSILVHPDTPQTSITVYHFSTDSTLFSQ